MRQLLENAQNADQLNIRAYQFKLAATLDALSTPVSTEQLLPLATSYSLTNPAGNLGTITEPQSVIVEGATNAGLYTFTIAGEGRNFTLSEALAAQNNGSLPAVYTITPGSTFNAGTLSVEQAAAAVFVAPEGSGLPNGRVVNLLAGAQNAAQLSLGDFDYVLRDSLTNLSSQVSLDQLLPLATSHALTNPAGNLGVITEIQAGVVRSASNAALYAFTVAGGDGKTFTLTTAIETLPPAGTVAAADAVFNAPAGTNQNGAANTLQTGDVLNGSGQENVLNATIVAGYDGTTPNVNNIPTANFTALVAPGGAGNGINASRFAGLTTVGNIDSAANFAMNNLGALSTVNITNNIGTDTVLIANGTALAGAADTVALNLSNSTGNSLVNLSSATPTATNGYETINIASTGNNTIGQLLTTGSVDNINVSGGSLTIAGAAAAPIDNSVASFNAAAMTGALTLGEIGTNATNAQSSALNAGGASLNFVGSNSGTTLYVDAATLGTNDTLNGGTGVNDTLVLTGASGTAAANRNVATNANAFNASGFENLSITDTNGGGATNAVNFNLLNTTGITGIKLSGGNAGSSLVTLNNLNYAAPITVTATGTGQAGAQTINGLTINALGAFGTADTVNYVYGNQGVAVGTNAVASGALSLNGMENLNFTFNDFSAGTTFNGLGLTADTTNSARAVTVNAASGSNVAGSIDLGVVGNRVAGSVREVRINSAAGVTAQVNNAAGANLITQGAGNHTLTSLVDATAVANAAVFNGTASTGVLNFTGTAAADQFFGGSQGDTFTTAGGNDAMTGAGGADTFTLTVVGGDVVINDLAAGGADVLDINALPASVTSTVVANWNATADTDLRNAAARNVLVFNTNGFNVNLDAVVNTGGAVNGFGATINNNGGAAVLTGSDWEDAINGGAGNDTIVGGTGADFMNGGAGADQFGTGNNFGAAGTSVVAGAVNFAGANVAAADTLTFNTTAAGTVDTITGFVSGTDKLDVVAAGVAPTALVGNAAAGALTNGETYVAYGAYNAATGVFTIAAAFGAGNDDALVVTGNGVLTPTNTTGYQVITNLNQALVAADFV